jgi:hypothetical protein
VILAFEHRTWPLPGSKETAITAEFGITSTRYYQQLNKVLDDPVAEAADPVLVHRLQRLRTSRRPGRRR